MRPLSQCVVVGVLGLAAGLMGGLSLGPELRDDAPGSTSTESRTQRRAAVRQVAVVTEKHDFQTLMRWEKEDPRTAAIRPELERMSGEALMGLLAELALVEITDGNESYAVLVTRTAVAKELYRRKGMGALEEAEKDPHPGRRHAMIWALAEQAAKASPAAAMEWMKAHRAKDPTANSPMAGRWVIEGGTQAGAAELIALHERYSTFPYDVNYPHRNFPPDFDFALLVKYFPKEGNEGMNQALTYWGAKDKEAAMAAIRENIGEHGKGAAVNIGAMFKGVAAMEGNEKAAEWMATQLDSLPEEARTEALRSFNPGFSSPQARQVNAITAGAMVSKLSREPDRIEFVGSALTPSATMDMNLRMLKALPSTAEQEKALMKAMRSFKGYGEERLPIVMDRYAAELNLTDEARARVMEGMKAELGR